MASDFFLKLDKIQGESTQQGHTNEIDILSLSYGASAPSQIGTGSAGLSGGKASFHDINFTKHTDKSSPALFKAVGSGLSIGTAVFTGQKQAGGDKPMIYFKITLTNTLVTSYSTSGSRGDSILMEAVSFAYSKIVFDYTAQNADNTPGATSSGGYDVVTNKLVG